MFTLPADTVQNLSRHWNGRLAHYRKHQNDEHREALISEALRFVGFRLESELTRSTYWAEAPLARRVAVVLYLLDRGAIVRALRAGKLGFDVNEGAEDWARSQPGLSPYLEATLELLAALRREQASPTRPVE
jgi:hypothetical protein